MAEQAKILYAEAEANNLGDKAKDERFNRWHTCSLCEQFYHGVVRCALELLRTAQRIYGPANPLVKNIKETLDYAQKKLASLDAK